MEIGQIPAGTKTNNNYCFPSTCIIIIVLWRKNNIYKRFATHTVLFFAIFINFHKLDIMCNTDIIIFRYFCTVTINGSYFFFLVGPHHILQNAQGIPWTPAVCSQWPDPHKYSFQFFSFLHTLERNEEKKRRNRTKYKKKKRNNKRIYQQQQTTI